LNTNAIVSIVLCLVAPIFLTCAIWLSLFSESWLVPLLVICVLCPLAAAIFGQAARRELRTAGAAGVTSRKVATAGLAIGYLELTFLLVTFFSPIPRPSRMLADELTAVGSLRTLNFAAGAYRKAHPREGFPISLRDMSSNGSQLDSDWLTGEIRFRYRYTYVPKITNGAAVVDAYQVFADPLDPKNQNARHFFTNQSEIIRMSKGSPANESSTTLQ
jgi:hypothetical protein